MLGVPGNGVLVGPRPRRAKGTGTPQPLTRGKVLERLGGAQRAARRAEGRLVREVLVAREYGLTWKEIGLVVGMTGQGASKRYGPKSSPTGETPIRAQVRRG